MHKKQECWTFTHPHPLLLTDEEEGASLPLLDNVGTGDDDYATPRNCCAKAAYNINNDRHAYHMSLSGTIPYMLLPMDAVTARWTKGVVIGSVF